MLVAVRNREGWTGNQAIAERSAVPATLLPVAQAERLRKHPCVQCLPMKATSEPRRRAAPRPVSIAITTIPSGVRHDETVDGRIRAREQPVVPTAQTQRREKVQRTTESRVACPSSPSEFGSYSPSGGLGGSSSRPFLRQCYGDFQRYNGVGEGCESKNTSNRVEPVGPYRPGPSATDLDGGVPGVSGVRATPSVLRCYSVQHALTSRIFSPAARA
jgi:hypothetical protein